MNRLANTARARQGGAALIVAMIILVIMTIVGLASIGGSNMEMRMVNSTQERQQAFWGAESGLFKVEQAIENHGFDINQLFSTCQTGLCFNTNCVGGLCFNGSYLPIDSPLDCSNDLPLIPVWLDPVLNIWGNDARHGVMPVDGLKHDVQFIVEFMCYVIKDESSVFDITNPTNGAPLFRVTVLAQSNSGNAEVMLQSTYKWLNAAGAISATGGGLPGLPLPVLPGLPGLPGLGG